VPRRLSPNRLNVAVSRAQALAIVVGSPVLLEVRCKSVEEMMLVNLLCHLVQHAEAYTNPVIPSEARDLARPSRNVTRSRHGGEGPSLRSG